MLCCITMHSYYFICPCINKLSRDKTLEMKPQAERHWALRGPVFQSVALQSDFITLSACQKLLWKKKNHISLCIYHTVARGYNQQPSPLWPDTIALDKIPVPAPQRHPPLPAHLVYLSLWQCPTLLPQSRLSWQGACYVLVPSIRAILSSSTSQTSRDTWDSQKREGYWERISKGEGKLCSHFLFFISFWAFSPTMPENHFGNGRLGFFCGTVSCHWLVGGEKLSW